MALEPLTIRGSFQSGASEGPNAIVAVAIVMKRASAAWILIASVWLSGCTAARQELVLDPVGPPPAASDSADGVGSLTVFSAFEPAPSFNSVAYRRQYTDYRVFSADGKELIRSVNNDTGKLLDGPRVVELPAGKYRVFARANGYGTVAIPVTIKPERLTTVHLEGGTWWPRSSPIFQASPVRLPDGQIVGWPAVD